MAAREEAVRTPVQPGLTELFAGYLQRQASAHAAGLPLSDTAAEVLPFDVEVARTIFETSR